MKRIICVLLFVLACSSFASSQDLLVTVRRDTINCKLGSLKGDQYPISFVLDDEMINGTIHKDSILFYKKNVFRNIRSNRIRPWYPLIDFGIDGGMAHQFGTFRVEDDMTDKGDFAARTGFIVGADMTFYVSKGVGYGLKYSYRSLLGGDVKYQYFGPLMAFRFWDAKRCNNLFLMFSAGYGWMVQKNAPVQLFEARPLIEMHAHSISGDIAVGYNFRLSKNISLRAKLSGIIGWPKTVKVMDISKYVHANEFFDYGDYCNNMNTVNLSLGFTFHK